MRDFPFDGCLTTDELLAYGRMQTAEPDLEQRVLEHLATCTACVTALSKLSDAPETVPPPPVGRSARALEVLGNAGAGKSLPPWIRVEETLARQRRQLASMLNDPRPAVSTGQVWAVDWSWDLADLDTVLDTPVNRNDVGDLAPMVLVLRSFLRHTTGLPVIDLIPLTNDPHLAAEWSIAFSATVSGLEVPLVAHVDYQFTASPDRLGRCLGTLNEAAWTDVLTVSRAWGQGEFLPSELKVGRLGQPGIRDWPAWATWEDACKNLLKAMLPADPEEAVRLGVSVPALLTPEDCLRGVREGKQREDIRITMSHPTTLAQLLTIHVQRERYRDLHDWCRQNEPTALSIVERIGQAPITLFDPPTNWRLRLTTHVGQHLSPNMLRLISAWFGDHRRAMNQEDCASLARKAARQQDA